jgi:hypothetical protein
VTSTVIPISTTALSPQNGDKNLTITLSNMSVTGPGTVAVLGGGEYSASSISDNVTIVDTSPSTRVSLPLTETSDAETVETTGPYASTGYLLNVAGTSSAHYYDGYVPMDFNDPSYNGYEAPNGQPYDLPTNASITAIDSISLIVTQAGANAGTTGPIDVFLVPDSISNIDPGTNPVGQSGNPHYFNTKDAPTGMDTSSPTNTSNPGTYNSFGTPMLLGTATVSPGSTDGATITIPLVNFTTATENTLIADIESGQKFRIVAAPANSTVYTSWNGNINTTLAPMIQINVSEPGAAGVAPTIASTQVGDGAVQRSSIQSVSVTFNEPVNLATGSFTMYQEVLNSNGSINTSATATNVTADISATLSNNNETVTFAVNPNSGIDRNGFGFFTNGIYQLMLNGSAITDQATNSANFDNGGSMPVSFANSVAADNGTSSYFGVLFGDVNGDGTVNNSDARVFNNGYLTSTGQSNYNISMDFNDDGTINNSDTRKENADYLVTYTY